MKRSIPSLEDLSLSQRIVAAVVIIVAVVIVLFIVGMLTVEGQQRESVSPRFEKRLVELDKEAVEEAYKKHIMRLFEVWVTEYGRSTDQPSRTVQGARNARDIYVKSMTAIEKRETHQ